MITIGVDYHKRTSSYRVLDGNGKTLKTCKLLNERETIRHFVSSIDGPKRLAMEATRNWGLYHDNVVDLVDDFYLGHPKKMKAITESETKNDTNDAHLIARLASSGFFPQAHVSGTDTRQLRSVLRFRSFLVNQRKAIRNQIHILIDRNLWPSERPQSFKSPFCKKGLQWLGTVSLPQRERFLLNQCLQNFNELNAKIKDTETFIENETVDLPLLKYLRTVPGFKRGGINALVILMETDDITRFHKARGFAHYAGLIPREFSSGDNHRAGRLVKQANMRLRTAFIESTFGAILADKGLRDYYNSVKKRTNSSAAIIATARKLACAVYCVLKEQRPFRPYDCQPPAAAWVLPAVSSKAR
jgi:transposase